MQQQRQQALELWLEKTLPRNKLSITKLAGDASFRRYFRIHDGNQTFIAMDAPPEKENNHAFVAIANSFAKHGLDVPEILASDLNQGFLLLSDLGDRLYLTELTPQNADLLYEQALAVIPHIQACQKISDWELPHFGEKIIVTELELFVYWFLNKHLDLELNHSTQTMLTQTFNQLIRAANEQPQVCVHRDYHSRNLLCLNDQRVGVLDFQDAVWGPFTYDVVSLLRDCYISWSPSQVCNWALQFYDLYCTSGQFKEHSKDQFLHWFDFVGIQRHLKVLGIFARLYHRDGKGLYLNDIPRILNYLIQVSENYTELDALRTFLQTIVVTKLYQKKTVAA